MSDIDNAQDRLWGRDLFFDLRSENLADLQVNAAGDWLQASSAEALRQSIRRRMITAPGEWAAKPEYGAGLPRYVKSRLNETTRNEIVERVRSQCLLDERVEGVESVDVTQTENALRLFVKITPVGRLQTQNTIDIDLEVS